HRRPVGPGAEGALLAVAGRPRLLVRPRAGGGRRRGGDGGQQAGGGQGKGEGLQSHRSLSSQRLWSMKVTTGKIERSSIQLTDVYVRNRGNCWSAWVCCGPST